MARRARGIAPLSLVRRSLETAELLALAASEAPAQSRLTGEGEVRVVDMASVRSRTASGSAVGVRVRAMEAQGPAARGGPSSHHQGRRDDLQFRASDQGCRQAAGAHVNQ